MRSVLSFLLFIIAFNANAQTFVWAKQFGNSGNTEGKDLAIDGSGNVYSTGYLVGTADFDPGPAVYTLSQPTGAGAYVSKLDANGNFVWAKQFESWNIISNAIAMDASGNVYVAGFYQQTVDFDPGPGVFTLTTPPLGQSSHGFVCKLDNNGNFIWAKEFGGAIQDYMVVYDLAIDVTGNLIMTGDFKNNADFDPGTAVMNLISWGQEDNFIIKLDANGNLIWVSQCQGPSYSSGRGLFVDPTGNIYTTGRLQDFVDFDPGPGTFNVSSYSPGHPGIFISKFNINGGLIWAKAISGQNLTDGMGNAVVADASGNVYFTGYFRGTMDFDPGPGIFNMTSIEADIFFMKMDMTGNFQWVKQIGGNLQQIARDITLDIAGNIFLCGDIQQGSGDFDPGPGVYTLNGSGQLDAFIAKYDINGGLIWAHSIYGFDSDLCFAVKTDLAGNLYATGLFSGTPDFDPGPGIYNMTAGGNSDAFVLKWNRCSNITQSDLVVTACTSYNLNNHSYNTSGTYIQVIPNVTGCDSIITLHLTIGGSVTNRNTTACDSYLWEGQLYNSSGQYTVTYTGTDGCDSVLHLDLTINNSVSTTVNASICEGQTFSGYTASGTYTDIYMGVNGCDSTRTLNLVVKLKSFSTVNTTICQGNSYMGHSTQGTYTETYTSANGCDSIRTLNLTVHPVKFTTVNQDICEGDSYFTGGAFQTQTGVYKDTLQTFQGCDSIVTTNLAVTSLPHPNLGADRDLCAGSTFTFTPGNFDSYLWQDMSTSFSYTANNVGLYWVTVSSGPNCTATDSVVIHFINPIPSNFMLNSDSVCMYEPITIRALNNYPGYLWSTGSDLSTILVNTPGLYWLMVTDANGCTGKDSTTVLPKTCNTGLFVPTAFTPNGDGNNDIFKPIVHGKTVSYRFQIFDRQGQLIFQTTDPDKGWNGSNNGTAYTSTVFVWQCFYQFENESSGYQKGTVTLIR